MLAWTALVGGGALAGTLAALALSLDRGPRGVTLTLAALSAAVSGTGLVVVSATDAGALTTAAGALLSLMGVLAGYALGAGILQSLPDPAGNAPKPPAAATTETDVRTAVLLLADVEPARYSARHTSAAIRDLEETDAATVPALLIPFFFAAQNTRYASLGGVSPARAAAGAIAERVATLLDPLLFAGPYPAFCSGEETLDRVMARARSAGHSSFVVAPLGVADSRPFERATEASLDSASQQHVRVASALWGSDEIAVTVAEQVLEVCRGAEVSTGVVLVAHGQPPQWEGAWAAFDEQEVSFVNRIREHLVEGGVPSHGIRVAWAAWREPDVTEAVRHVAALGSERVLVVPACEPVECLDTMIDLPHAVRMARVDVPARVLSAWGDIEPVASALAERIREAVR